MKNDPFEKLRAGNLKFKISFLLIFSLIFFPFRLNQTEAASTTLSKTVEFFIGQDGTARASGAQFSFYFNNVIIPEVPAVKSAIIEINGVSYNNSGNQTVNVDLKQGTAAAGAGTNYILGVTTKPKPFTIKYNACVYDNILQICTGSMSNIVSANTAYDYTLYLKDTSAGGSVSFSIASAKLILTYNYSASSSNLLKTTKFFIEQKINQVTSGNTISKPFTISISEKSSPEDAPLIRSVFVEIGGIAKGNVAGRIETKMTKAGPDPGYSLYNLDLASSSCGAACNVPFLVRYDASSIVVGSDFANGSKDYTFYFRGTDFDTNLLSAKIIITYKYTESLGGLPAKGELISSTFNTGVTGGAGFNSIMWKGSLNSGVPGQVGLQIATSDSDIGPWIFKGPNCSSAYYAAEPNVPMDIICPEQNNKKYFRYKVIICSSADCAALGSINPRVDEVVVNWSP